MQTPRIFLSYAPRAGLRAAVAYLADDRNVYGWFIGRSESGIRHAYFMLEDFYTPLPTRYVAVDDADLHSPWLDDDAKGHELARMQQIFEREWLVHRGDPDSAPQLRQYAEAELAAGELAVRFERLNRFSKAHANWTFYSPDFEHGVLKALGRHWPLDYRVSDVAVA